MNDLLERLAALPDADPSPVRARRVRAMARSRLSPARPDAASPRPRRRGTPLAWLAAGVSAVYLAKAVAMAVEMIALRIRV